MALAVTWTFAVAICAWIDLPRAPNMPHDPGFIGKLSPEAAAIMRSPSVAAERGAGTLVWSDTPRLMRMANGMLLTFPAITTNERAAIVGREYRRLLDIQAGDQRLQYLLGWLTVWLATLLIAGLALTFMSGRKRTHDPATAAAQTMRRTDARAVCLPAH